MLNTLRNITGNRTKIVQEQVSELELLLATARDERNAISAMLTTLAMQSAKLTPFKNSLEQIATKSVAATTRLGEIDKRLISLDDRTREVEAIDARIQALRDAARQAEQTTQTAIGPDGELRKHREAVQQLSSQALQTHASLETLKKERVVFEELREQLRESEGDVKQAVAQTGTLRGEFDQIRATATSLAQDYSRIRETSREAREDATAAMTTVKEIDKKLEPLAQLQELSQSAEERLVALNALSEHVTRKARALEGQQQVVEHAVVQTNRVNEMVWSMDVQIRRITEAMKQAGKAEETLGRIERLSDDTSQRMTSATKLNEDVQREAARLQKESTHLLDEVRNGVGALAIAKKELDASDERVQALQLSVTDAEARMAGIAAKDKDMTALGAKVEGLTTRFDALFTQSDELTKKQLVLESLHERLSQVDELSTKTVWQMEILTQSRQDLEGLRTEIQDFYKSHASIAQLCDKLGADRLVFEGFIERMAAMSARAPELEAKMDGILGKMALVDEGTHKATRLHESVAALDAQASRVAARVPFVEKLESRLDGLNAVSADVDRKLESQLARRAEVETMKSACDGLSEQIGDAQLKLGTVRTTQAQLLPLVAELDRLRTEIVTARDRIETVKYDDDTIAAHQKRFADLVASSKAVAAEVAERTRQMQALSEEVARATALKDELSTELDRVRSRQREAASQVHASEDQLVRTEKMFKQLEQRRTQVAFGEKKLTAVETRLGEIKQVSDELDRDIHAITLREQLVSAVKAEVEQVHQIGARSKADLVYVAENRSEITALKASVDELLSRIAETDERMASIDARRKVVDEVQAKANSIVNLLADVRINLETLGEQRAVIDHVTEKAAQLELVLQDAKNTLRALQQERELAERIGLEVSQLRWQTGPPKPSEPRSVDLDHSRQRPRIIGA